MIHIYPSLMAANPLNYGFIITQLEPYCAGFHIDVMDNHFVPNLTFGPAIINKMATATIRPFWVHIMAENPSSIIRQLMLPPSSLITIHIELESEIKKTIKLIREKSYGVGLALSPKNKASEIIPFLGLIDQVLVMSVEPGFSGQQFLPTVIDTLDEAVTIKKRMNANVRMGMDGGITADNIALLAEKGVQDFAIGSTVFDDNDPVTVVKDLAKRTRHTS